MSAKDLGTVHVEVATPADLAAIREAYAHARAIQRQQGSTVWPEFNDAVILAEIDASHLFRAVDGNTVAGIFSVAFEDEAIWGERERGASRSTSACPRTVTGSSSPCSRRPVTSDAAR